MHKCFGIQVLQNHLSHAENSSTKTSSSLGGCFFALRIGLLLRPPPAPPREGRVDPPRPPRPRPPPTPSRPPRPPDTSRSPRRLSSFFFYRSSNALVQVTYLQHFNCRYLFTQSDCEGECGIFLSCFPY